MTVGPKRRRVARDPTAGPVSFRERCVAHFLSAAVRAYYWAIHLTSRRVLVGGRHLARLHTARSPRIYAVWHSCVFFAPSLGYHEPEPSAALVSSRGNGHLFAQVLRGLGHETVRGSSSRRGQAAYRELRALLRKGTPVVLSPDGPRGPAFRVRRGLIQLALRSGALIVPAHFESTRQWQRNTWDEQRIPLPMGTIVVAFGKPIRGDEGPERVERALRANRDRCRAVCARLAGRA